MAVGLQPVGRLNNSSRHQTTCNFSLLVLLREHKTDFRSKSESLLLFSRRPFNLCLCGYARNAAAGPLSIFVATDNDSMATGSCVMEVILPTDKKLKVLYFYTTTKKKRLKRFPIIRARNLREKVVNEADFFVLGMFGWEGEWVSETRAPIRLDLFHHRPKWNTKLTTQQQRKISCGEVKKGNLSLLM